MADSSPPDSGADPGSLPRGPEPMADAPTLDASPLLFRRYRVERELGRGGMGQVMLAHDTALGIHVALKLVSDIVAKDTDAVSDLRKEVLRGMALMHPGIVRTHNFERDEAGAAIVMEYIEGNTLSDLKASQPGGCFDPPQILPWLEQLCSVLDYAHRDARIVHRDLKPRNVMLTREGRIKVADFGISATLSDSQSRHSMEGVNSGTPPYMSPQQAQGKRPTALDDVYALGATIYELLTGKPPFFRGNILMQVLGETAPSMTERREELEVRDRTAIPPAWEATITACLAKDPAQRPATAGEVLVRLRDEIRGGSATATQVSMPRVELPSAAAAISADEALTLPETKPPPPVLASPPFTAPPATRRMLWPWAAGIVLLALAVGAGVYFSDGTHRDANKTPRASAPGRNAAAPDAQQLLAEARTLRENEANLLARDRLQAALTLEPANPAVLAELAAVNAVLAPAAGTAPAASERPATPASTNPAASVALVRQITGSSTLQSQVDNAGHRNFYEAGNAIDGKVSTAWVAARGAKDVWLRVEFEREVTVSRFVLFPGYGKDADAFAKNNRVKAFALEFPGGRAFQFSCADRRASQTFLLPEPVTSATLIFRVLEVYRAETYGGDTPISEIGF